MSIDLEGTYYEVRYCQLPSDLLELPDLLLAVLAYYDGRFLLLDFMLRSRINQYLWNIQKTPLPPNNSITFFVITVVALIAYYKLIFKCCYFILAVSDRLWTRHRMKLHL
jgi:hypothetical protein